MALPPPTTSTSHGLHYASIEKPKIVSAYRWEDESNGEIYTDMPIDQGEEMKDLPLYVVENGQEFPLLPLSQRKTSFEFVPRLPSQPLMLSSVSSDAPIPTRPSTLSLAPPSSVTEFEPKAFYSMHASQPCTQYSSARTTCVFRASQSAGATIQ